MDIFCYDAMLNSHASIAHSEHDKARFVAETGKDTGKCDQVLRPCKSIAYAVQQANKGDKILVSAGEYTINSSEELFYLKSALVPILGGYNRFDHFQSQSPASNPTELKNIPLDMAEPFASKALLSWPMASPFLPKTVPKLKPCKASLKATTP